MHDNEERTKPKRLQDQQKMSGGLKPSEAFRQLREVLQEGFVSVVYDDSDAIQPESITNPELLDLSEPLARTLYSTTKFRQRSETANQFRKFFHEINGLKNLLNNPAKLSIELRMLKARMSYAAGREIITNDFSTMINICIDRIIELSDFRSQVPGFCDFFESLYAYYYYHNKLR